MGLAGRQCWPSWRVRFFSQPTSPVALTNFFTVSSLFFLGGKGKSHKTGNLGPSGPPVTFPECQLPYLLLLRGTGLAHVHVVLSWGPVP